MTTIETILPFYLKGDYKKDGPHLSYFSPTGVPNPEPEKFTESDTAAMVPETKATVYDARELQNNSNMSNAEFFKEHGFVLLDSKT